MAVANGTEHAAAVSAAKLRALQALAAVAKNGGKAAGCIPVGLRDTIALLDVSYQKEANGDIVSWYSQPDQALLLKVERWLLEKNELGKAKSLEAAVSAVSQLVARGGRLSLTEPLTATIADELAKKALRERAEHEAAVAGWNEMLPILDARGTLGQLGRMLSALDALGSLDELVDAPSPADCVVMLHAAGFDAEEAAATYAWGETLD